jgi:hypothetical protein
VFCDINKMLKKTKTNLGKHKEQKEQEKTGKNATKKSGGWGRGRGLQSCFSRLHKGLQQNKTPIPGCIGCMS